MAGNRETFVDTPLRFADYTGYGLRAIQRGAYGKERRGKDVMRGIRCAALVAAVSVASMSSAGASDAPVGVAVQLDGGAIHVPRPSYTQVFAADVVASTIQNDQSAKKIDRDGWAWVVRPGVDITFNSPDPSLGRRWTLALRGGVMNYDNLRENRVSTVQGLSGRIITQRITGGTSSTTPGAGAEAYSFDTRTQYRGSLSYYDAGARLASSFSYGSVTVRPSIGVAVWSFDFDESIVNTALGASTATSNTLKLDTSSWNVGPVIGMAVDIRVHPAVKLGIKTFISPYHADMDVNGRQTFTGGGQGGTPPVKVSDDRDTWGVRGGGKLSVAVNLTDNVTFAVAAEVDALSHVPYAKVPDSQTSGALEVKSDRSVFAGFTAGLRVRF